MVKKATTEPLAGCDRLGHFDEVPEIPGRKGFRSKFSNWPPFDSNGLPSNPYSLRRRSVANPVGNPSGPLSSAAIMSCRCSASYAARKLQAVPPVDPPVPPMEVTKN